MLSICTPRSHGNRVTSSSTCHQQKSSESFQHKTCQLVAEGKRSENHPGPKRTYAMGPPDGELHPPGLLWWTMVSTSPAGEVGQTMRLRGFPANLRPAFLDCGKLKARSLLSIEDCSESFRRMGCPFARHCARYFFLAHLLSSSPKKKKTQKIKAKYSYKFFVCWFYS